VATYKIVILDILSPLVLKFKYNASEEPVWEHAVPDFLKVDISFNEKMYPILESKNHPFRLEYAAGRGLKKFD
jgi:hypothetical protein